MQPGGGRQEVFESAPIFDPISRRQLQTGFDIILYLIHERPEISAPYVCGDDDTALSVFTANLVRPRRDFEMSELSCSGTGLLNV